MRKLIDKQKVMETWAPVIESATGLTAAKDHEKVSWMAEYSHWHSVNEASNATLTNVNGMGAIRFPGDPGAQQDFAAQANGSGDNPASLLPLSMQVAAQTVGLDTIPVVPMDRPLTTLTYVDTVYADGKLDQAGADAPSILKFNVTIADDSELDAIAVGADVWVGNATDGANDGTNIGTFIGRSRIDGYLIVKYDQTIGSPASIITDGATLDIAGTTFAGTTVSGTPDLVRALEDHITGFSGRYFLTGDAKDLNMPYQREEGEDNSSRSLGFKFRNKSVEAQTYQADVAVTREQLQDSKQFGIDLISMANSVLANETTQSINKNILERAFALGATNHKQVFNTERVHFNVNFDDGVSDPVVFNLGVGQDGAPVSLSVAAGGAPPAKIDSGGETLLTAQRRVLDQMLAAGNLISHRGRRGPANIAVTNTQVGTLLQSISGFQAAPMANSFNQNNGSMYPLGSIAGINVFVDPNMKWSDTRVCVWKKGDASSPGLVMMPYMMAESVETIAEATMAPKIQVKSRYALVEAGHLPQVYFLTFEVKSASGLLR